MRYTGQDDFSIISARRAVFCAFLIIIVFSPVGRRLLRAVCKYNAFAVGSGKNSFFYILIGNGKSLNTNADINYQNRAVFG